MNIRIMAGLALLILMELFAVNPARAAGSTKNGTLSLVVENDLFYDIDRHYTSGVRLNWVPSRESSTPEWAVKFARLVPWFPEKGEIRHGYALGQSVFTPGDIKIADPPLSERPYAGWLYGTIGLGLETGRQLDQFALTIGMVGPASLAGQSQKIVHRLIDSDDPKGWDTQLHNEPGIVVTCQRSLREFATTTFLGNQIDFTPHAGIVIGNVFTYGNAGLTIRYGRQLPKDYGPPRIQPGLPGSGDFSPATDFGWYIFAGFEGRVIGRNIFLDGNSFRDSRSVDKEYLVGDFQFGLVLDLSNIRLSYTHVLRTHEFRTQEGNDDFGAITLSVKF